MELPVFRHPGGSVLYRLSMLGMTCGWGRLAGSPIVCCISISKLKTCLRVSSTVPLLSITQSAWDALSSWLICAASRLSISASLRLLRSRSLVRKILSWQVTLHTCAKVRGLP